MSVSETPELLTPNWLATLLRSHFKRASQAESAGSAKAISAGIIRDLKLDGFDDDDDDAIECEKLIEEELLASTFENLTINQSTSKKWGERAFWLLEATDGVYNAKDTLESRCQLKTFGQEPSLLSRQIRMKQVERIIFSCFKYHISGRTKSAVDATCNWLIGRHVQTCEASALKSMTPLIEQLIHEKRTEFYQTRESISSKLQLLRQENSLTDRDGLISFRQKAEKIGLDGAEPSDVMSVGYSKELNRIANRIINKRLHISVGNVDKELPELFLEYQSTLALLNSDKLLIYSLWSIGCEIEDRINYAIANDQDQIDENRLISFRSFFATHHLFTMSFDSLGSALRARAMNSFISQNSTFNFGTFIGTLAASRIFDDKSIEFMVQMATKVNRRNQKNAFNSAEEGAIAAALLRGSLNEVGHTTIRKINNIIENSDGENLKEDVSIGFNRDELSRAINEFLQSEHGNLERLATELPNFFNYWKSLLPLIPRN